MGKTKETMKFDVTTGWKKTTVDTKKKNYDIQFVNGEGTEINFEDYYLTSSGNNATVTAETNVQYYATIKVNKNFVVDGHMQNINADGKWDSTGASFNYDNGKMDISDAFVDATYKYKGKNINLAKYNTLSEAEQANCTFVDGTLNLTIQTGASHNSKDVYNSFYFTTDKLYDLEETFGETGQYIPENTSTAVKFMFDSSDFEAFASRDGGSFYSNAQKEALHDGDANTVTGLHIYKVVNGKTTEVKLADFLADKGDKTDDAYNRELLAETAESTIVLKNFGKTGDVSIFAGTGSIADLTTEEYEVTGKKSFTGSRLNEKAWSSSMNETFNLGTGHDEVIFHNDLLGLSFGKDTVTVNSGESLNLDFGVVPEDIYLSYNKKGNNLVINANTVHEMDYKKVTITGATKVTEGEHKGQWTYTEEVSEYDFVKKEWGNPTDGTIKFSDKKVKNGTTYNTYTDGELTATSSKEQKNFDVYTTSIDSAATLKNYFKVGNEASVTKNNVLLSNDLVDVDGIGVLGYATADKNQTLTGNFLNNTFNTGRKNDTVKTGAGEDLINASAGKDKVTIDGFGEKYFEGNKLADGKTTITFAKGAMAYTEGAVSEAKTSLYIDDMIDEHTTFTKSGNDLVVNKFTPIDDDEFAEGSVTVSNYFKTDYVAENTWFEDFGGDEYYYRTLDFTTEGDDYLTVVGNSKKLTGSAYNDIIVAGKKTTTINAGDGNNRITQSDEGQIATFNAGKDNDTYNIVDLNTTIDINDKGGTDTLNVIFDEAPEDDKLVALFDVKKDSSTKSKKYDDFTTMRFATKDNIAAELEAEKFDGLSMSLEIKNYFGENYENGSGKIEYINYDGKAVTVDVNAIVSGVQSWLSDAYKTKGYTSAFDVLKKGDVADITTLVAIYDTNTVVADLS